MEPGVFLLIRLGISFICSLYCYDKASQLNRNKAAWGWRGFLFPIISVIVILFLKPLTVWDKNVDIEKEEESLKREMELKLLEDSRKRDEELKLEEEARQRKEKELAEKLRLEDESRKLGEELEKKKIKETEIIKESTDKNGNSFLIFILIVIIVIGGIYFYQIYQQKIEAEEKLKAMEDKELMDFAIADSTKIANEAKEAMDKAIQDSLDAASQALQDTIITLTPGQLQEYYIGGKNDTNVKLFRKKIDEYLSGELSAGSQIEQLALDSMNTYDKEYFESKFMLATIDDAEYGGKWMRIVFINRPDKVFSVWVHNYSIYSFSDALWNEAAINMVQNNKQLLDTAYGF